jgi:hypothetical protein
MLKWEGIIKVDREEIICKDVDWIQLAKGRAQKRTINAAVIYFRIPQKRGIS